MKKINQNICSSSFFDQYMQLIDSNINNDLKDRDFQKHHVIPESLGGKNDNDNIVGLRPRDHVRAHELLFKHFMFCAQNMARAYASMVGSRKSEFKDAESLSDEYDSELKRAYDVMRKRTVFSLKDMSRKKIGFFEKTPDGYIELPETTANRVSIFNTSNRAAFHKWPAEMPIPSGWKKKDELDETEKQFFPNIFKKPSYCAYDPATLDFGKFRGKDIPKGWLIYDISNPARLLAERKQLLENALEKAVDDRVRIMHKRAIDEIGELMRQGGGLRLDKCELYGLYRKDGIFMSLNRWCERAGISYGIVYRRMFVYGLPFGEAIKKISQKEACARLKGMNVKRGHTDAFLKKHAAAEERKRLQAEADAEKKAQHEKDLAEKRLEFRELGWGGFASKYGKKQCRLIYFKLKRRFGNDL